MARSLETVLDECLALLRQGADVESCLARYPEYAQELKGLLETASLFNDLEAPQPRFQAIENPSR